MSNNKMQSVLNRQNRRSKLLNKYFRDTLKRIEQSNTNFCRSLESPWRQECLAESLSLGKGQVKREDDCDLSARKSNE